MPSVEEARTALLKLVRSDLDRQLKALGGGNERKANVIEFLSSKEEVKKLEEGRIIQSKVSKKQQIVGGWIIDLDEGRFWTTVPLGPEQLNVEGHFTYSETGWQANIENLILAHVEGK
jgi:hypothetical protein